MIERRVFTADELRLIEQLNEQRVGASEIARRLHCARYTIVRQFGDRIHRANYQPGVIDPVTAYPIGEVPKGHPLYHLDQQMARARSRRAPVDHGWKKSSLVE